MGYNSPLATNTDVALEAAVTHLLNAPYLSSTKKEQFATGGYPTKQQMNQATKNCKKFWNRSLRQNFRHNLISSKVIFKVNRWALRHALENSSA
jgi:hypothetical protein